MSAELSKNLRETDDISPEGRITHTTPTLIPRIYLGNRLHDVHIKPNNVVLRLLDCGIGKTSQAHDIQYCRRCRLWRRRCGWWSRMPFGFDNRPGALLRKRSTRYAKAFHRVDSAQVSVCMARGASLTVELPVNRRQDSKLMTAPVSALIVLSSTNFSKQDDFQ